MNECWMTRQHSDVVVLYIHVPGDHLFWHKTKRFIETYKAHPPGAPHKMIVVSQRREPYADVMEMLKQLNCPYEIFVHDNSAKDIGAFLHYAKVCQSPMMVCLSGTTYFRRAGWLRRMIDVFNKYNGQGLFGACGNSGAMHINAHPHIRTSSFWCQPALLNSYPIAVTDDGQRYPFEHGPMNFTLWTRRAGLPTVVVDFSNHWEAAEWGRNPRGYHQSDQLDLLVGDRNTEPPDYPHP